MKTNKCEICGATKDLTTVSVKPCEYSQKIFTSCLCEECERKYRAPYLRFFYANETVAQNLVREYREREMTSSKPKIVLPNEAASELIRSCPELREKIIEEWAKVFEEAIENAKRETGTGTHQSG